MKFHPEHGNNMLKSSMLLPIHLIFSKMISKFVILFTNASNVNYLSNY